jgi:adenylyl cyclase-associated protein
VYLSAESANAEIVSSKSSEMNILVPDKSGDFVSDDFVGILEFVFVLQTEHAVPEQYRSVFVQGKGLVTTVVDV